MKELRVAATDENLNTINAFIEGELEACDCPPKATMQLMVAVEEIYVNIAHYAYGDREGEAVIRVDRTEDGMFTIAFMDNGEPFDPLAKPDPDITLSAMDRPIGGLGIFMVKKSMDLFTYEYRDSQNVVTIGKRF